jgi:hypothetical protein
MGRHIAVQEHQPESGVPAARHRVDNRPDHPVEKRRGRGVRRAAVILALAVVAVGTTAGLARAYLAPDRASGARDAGSERLVAMATASGAALTPGTTTRVTLVIQNPARHAVTLTAFGDPAVTVEPAVPGCDPASVRVIAPEPAGVLVPAAGRQMLPLDLVMSPDSATSCQGATVQVRMRVSGRPAGRG